MGRPTKGEAAKPLHVRYADVLEIIADRLAEGEPLRQILRNTPNMPSWRTVYDWIRIDPEVAKLLEAARKLGAHAIAESCLEIADDGTNDWVKNSDPDNPGYRLNGEHVQRSKLRVETRLKLLSKWHPKEYGDKITQEHTGVDGGPMQVTSINLVPLK